MKKLLLSNGAKDSGTQKKGRLRNSSEVSYIEENIDPNLMPSLFSLNSTAFSI